MASHDIINLGKKNIDGVKKKNNGVCYNIFLEAVVQFSKVVRGERSWEVW